MGEGTANHPQKRATKSKGHKSRERRGPSARDPSTNLPEAASTSEPDELSNADLLSLPGPHAAGGELDAGNSWMGEEVPSDTADPLLGTTLHDTYVVARVLGAGGMGRVYEAHHTRIRTKRYAIKVLHAEYSRNPEVRMRFQREAEAAATIEHDGVMGTYDVGETPHGWPYMVCEYLAGVDLHEYLKSHGALPWTAVVHVGRQLCGALSAAHARGVIHRDLKPHNIFVVQPQGQSPDTVADGKGPLPQVKVLDFGLSRFVERDHELTKTGIILGTPGYMAPEQAHGRDTDLRTDIYGIGALLFAACTGRAPFVEETPQLTVLAVMNREPPRPRELSPQLPIELEIIVQKAMARDPSQRYQTAHEMDQALQGLQDRAQGLAPRAPRNPAALSSPRLWLAAYAAAGLLLGTAALAAAGLALAELAGVRDLTFRPTWLEWTLFGLVGLATALGLWFLGRHFHRHTWANSAKLAELVPHVRSILAAAIITYGVSALLACGAKVVFELAGTDAPSEAILEVVLSINGFLGASAAAFRAAFQGSRRALLASFFARAFPGLAAAGCCFLLTLPWTYLAPRPHPNESRGAQVDTDPKHDPRPKAEVNAEAAPDEGPGASKPSSVPTPSLAQSTPEVPVPAAIPAGDPEMEAPDATRDAPQASKEALAIATEEGASALEKLRGQYPRDPRVLRALVLSYASRAETLDLAARSITALLELDITARSDPDVLYILKKALLAKGKAHLAATEAIRSHMGPEGAELLYDVMGEHPEQRVRLRALFQTLRSANQASPAVLIAYDLRYAQSCQGRLALLERAELHGDQRSVRQLQALSTAPRRCGWASTCYPICRAEAERFQKTAKAISRRLASAPSP